MTDLETIARRLAEGAPPGAPVEPLAFALRKLFEHDARLLVLRAHERSVCHRLAIYLEEAYRALNGRAGIVQVDCEYNRHDTDPKKVDGDLVYPDIIVHEREKDERNLLAIELKLSTNPDSDDDDIAKLRGYRGELHYQHALFLRLGAGDHAPGIVHAEWVEADLCNSSRARAVNRVKRVVPLAEVMRRHILRSF